jgi:hypothetical protein
MPLVAGHGRGHQLAVDLTHQKQLGLYLQLALDVLVWIVPGAGQVAALPEVDDGSLVGELEGADVHDGLQSVSPPF